MSEYNGSCLWFFIDDEYKADFVNQCTENGYAFHSGGYHTGSLTVGTCGNRMAHQQDKTIWYVSGICWYYSFNTPQAIINVVDHTIGPSPRINYKAYIIGEKQYIYLTREELVEPQY
ncbi:MAG: hypothetical protein FWG21_00875 [Oscillospiraceae bacterium]|nr:hypothetical protein [Oscillospiraceae bacterium]